MNFESIVLLLITAVATVGEPKALEFSHKIATQEPDFFRSGIYALKGGISKLRAKVTASETKIDDSLVQVASDFIVKAAAQESIAL